MKLNIAILFSLLISTLCVLSNPVNSTDTINSIDTITHLNKRDNKIKIVWDSVCKIISSVNFLNKIVCSAGSYMADYKDRSLYQIPPGQCKRIPITNYDVTEVCSSAPYQLYFEGANYKLKGCYYDGKPGSTYYQCCQLKHDLVIRTSPVGAIYEPYYGTFCSGTNGGNKKAKSVQEYKMLNLVGSRDMLLYYRLKIMNDLCSKDLYSKDCNNAELNYEKVMKRDMSWKVNYVV